MKTFMLAVALSAALAAPLALCSVGPSGAQTPAAQSQADKDALTIEQALTVSAGLQQLSKYESVDKDGKPYSAYYDFSGDLRMVIALNIDLGRKLQSVHQAAQNDLVMQWVDPATGVVPETKRNAFNVESAKLLNSPSRVGFYHIKFSDLKLDKNPIPAPTLSMIIPIVDR